jgi:hypothetical protein
MAVAAPASAGSGPLSRCATPAGLAHLRRPGVHPRRTPPVRLGVHRIRGARRDAGSGHRARRAAPRNASLRRVQHHERRPPAPPPGRHQRFHVARQLREQQLLLCHRPDQPLQVRPAFRGLHPGRHHRISQQVSQPLRGERADNTLRMHAGGHSRRVTRLKRRTRPFSRATPRRAVTATVKLSVITTTSLRTARHKQLQQQDANSGTAREHAGGTTPRTQAQKR